MALERKKQQKIIPLKIDATFFFERAVRSLDRCHYDKALKYFRRAVEYEPENAVNHCNLAGVLAEIGSFEESNEILLGILEKLDPGMTECYYYLANNYANMDDFDSAEQAVLRYLETDEDGIYLEEAEEMVELLSYELGRPIQIRFVKSREGMYEHDDARRLLEEGKFVEATGVLQKLVKKHPDFLAARNNLALGYYYLGDFEKALSTVFDVLEIDEGNLHALCNLAIFYQHLGETEKLAELTSQLRKTYPFHSEYLFKLATTMGILGDHETAYRLFSRLLRIGVEEQDPSLYHYTAVAAFNTGRFEEARKRWRQAAKLDPQAEIARFYLDQMDRQETDGVFFHYHYHLPFEQKALTLQEGESSLSESIKRDPLIRSSFFWGLRHGDAETKLQVIQAFGAIADEEAEAALKQFLLEPDESDTLKRMALYALRSMGMTGPLPVYMAGGTRTVGAAPYSPSLPEWEEDWQAVLTLAHKQMEKRYDMVQQCDLETLWVEYLTCVYPTKPRIAKIEGWSAALEYLTAKMHRRAISFEEVAGRYGISAATVSRAARRIDEACGLKEKLTGTSELSADAAGSTSSPNP
ncbi:tetratricopeptide repeat protein [Gorillibacterium timonense]|uniref:tetratricopeptide repeat protein n=1 Tax=Gorillibacterium timonense TaxID=1689269 RepID=UPI00071C2396|nr:tetratricopeptide repeat protein [Gorillibacterium timonense]